MVFFFLPQGIKKDRKVHSGAEWEDLRSQRPAHHRSHRKGNACRILDLRDPACKSVSVYSCEVTRSLFPNTNFRQVEISIYEDRSSSGSSSGSSSVSSSTARWLHAPPRSSSWIVISLPHTIRYLVLNKLTWRIHILSTESLVSPGVLRHDCPSGRA